MSGVRQMDGHDVGAGVAAEPHGEIWRIGAERWEAALQALGEIAAAAAAAPHSRPLAALAVRHAGGLFDAAAVALYWWDEQTRTFITLAENEGRIRQPGPRPGEASPA